MIPVGVVSSARGFKSPKFELALEDVWMSRSSSFTEVTTGISHRGCSLLPWQSQTNKVRDSIQHSAKKILNLTGLPWMPPVWPAGCCDRVPLGLGWSNTWLQPEAPGQPAGLWVSSDCRPEGNTGCFQSVSHCGRSGSSLDRHKMTTVYTFILT